MPIYEYHCDACGHDFEEWHKHADDIQNLPCPECRKEAHRVISNTTFMLKGGGWYVTEYGGRKAEGATAPSSASSDSNTPAATGDAAPAAEKSAPAPKAAPKAEKQAAAAS